MISDDRLEAYARLVVDVGASVGPGREVHVEGNVEHAPFVRVLAHAAYRAGARSVEAVYKDKLVQAAHVEHAPEIERGASPPWPGHACTECAAAHERSLTSRAPG